MFRFVVIGFCLAALCGCQSGPPTCVMERHNISIKSIPAGADVFLFSPLTQKKELLGQTPIVNQSVQVVASYKGKGTEKLASTAGKVRVEVVKQGYLPYRGVINVVGNKRGEFVVRLQKIVTANDAPANE